jgi:hypothetical protein
LALSARLKSCPSAKPFTSSFLQPVKPEFFLGGFAARLEQAAEKNQPLG